MTLIQGLIISWMGCSENTEPKPLNEEDMSVYCNEDSTMLLIVEDVDCDGTPTSEDCDDDDASMPSEDADCDGVHTELDCDDDDTALLSIDNDQDCDGVLLSDDCDDDDPGLLAQAEDQDCDGSKSTDDCNDEDENVYPESDEICDGLDNDCDPVTTALPSEIDADGDGSLACMDCDDTDPDRYPGNVESFDMVDNNCNGSIETNISMSAANMEFSSTVEEYADLNGCTELLPYTDLTGDGHAEIVLGCANQDDLGKVYVLDGFTTLENQTVDKDGAIITISNSGSYDEFGVVLDLLSDMDGDSKPELFVAGEHYSYVFSSSDLEMGDAFTADDARLQISVGNWSDNNNKNPIQIGDVDDDGLRDLLIGSFLFRGSSLELQVSLISSDADIQFSTSYNQDSIDAVIHDLDGDGIDDILFSDQEYDRREDGWYDYFAGTVLGFYGGDLADGVWSAENADFQIRGDNEADSCLGRQIGAIDDISGDGHAEVLVGRRSWNGSAGWLYLIPSEELADGDVDYETFDLQYKLNAHMDDIFPSEIQSIGDIDGDGLGDLLAVSDDEMKAHIFAGADLAPNLGQSDWDYYTDVTAIDFQICTDFSGSCWRSTANVIGDFNGDGHRDLVLNFAKTLSDQDQYKEGLYVFWGPPNF
jgi:hypothetical protein